jgi:hypothetical protein
MVDQTLNLYLKTAGPETVASQQTDESGFFRFPAVPAGVPLTLGIGGGAGAGAAAGRPDYFLFDADRLFAPGELRENDDVRPERRGSPVVAPVVPLADRVASACRNVRSSGMHVLVVLPGDDSKSATDLIDSLLDADRFSVILRYLPVRVEPGERKTEAATLSKHGWALPGPGQVMLAALDGNESTIAAQALEIGPAASAAGEAFLKQHMPPARDALATLRAAREEARQTSRRVWIVIGGPRCGPCFRLGRWIEDHHSTLEKDLVIAKVMGALDAHDDEVIKQLPINDGDGIPWHAITEPDGTILATSHGPLGNIGFPSSIEGCRHFRQMLERSVRRLTAAEVEDLVRSLAPKP